MFLLSGLGVASVGMLLQVSDTVCSFFLMAELAVIICVMSTAVVPTFGATTSSAAPSSSLFEDLLHTLQAEGS